MEGSKKLNIWINGAFDVLHIGHICLLKYGASLGTVRVGLDTDERIRKAKGQDRPFNTLRDRIDFISSIKYVDSVVSFSSDDELENCIKDYNTDILLVGSDWEHKKVIGSTYSKEVKFFQRIPEYSTTAILRYEKSSNNRRQVY